MIMTKGVYVLAISINKNITIRVGALGIKDFKRGLYAYVGSAQDNLEKRIERHVRKTKKKFWHIDYLLDDDAVEVIDVFCKEAGKKEECELAKELRAKAIPVEGFGSSDCKCTSHLFKLENSESLEVLNTLLGCMHAYH